MSPKIVPVIKLLKNAIRNIFNNVSELKSPSKSFLTIVKANIKTNIGMNKALKYLDFIGYNFSF